MGLIECIYSWLTSVDEGVLIVIIITTAITAQVLRCLGPEIMPWVKKNKTLKRMIPGSGHLRPRPDPRQIPHGIPWG